MAYDKHDDDVYKVAFASRVLADSLLDGPSTHHMVEEEFLRIGKVFEAVLPGNEGLKGPSEDIARIGSDFSFTRIDAREAGARLKDAITDIRENYAAPIVYEGVDVSDGDEYFRRDNLMPGEKVRVATRGDGTPRVDPSVGLGDGPLTISGTYVRGELGGEYQGNDIILPTVEYEFEGREGRHDASLFQTENGREEMHGVLLVRDGRVFVTPVLDVGPPEWESSVSVGPSREVVGDAGRLSIAFVHPDGLEGLKTQLIPDPEGMRHRDFDKGPISGDFGFEPVSKDDRDGPVLMGSMPWSGRATEMQLSVAERQVDVFLAQEARGGTRFELAEGQDATFASYVARELVDPPKWISDSKGPEGHAQYVIGKGVSSDELVPRRMEELAAARPDRLTAFVVADAPSTIATAVSRSGEDMRWQAIDLHTGEIIRNGEKADAASLLGSMKEFQAGVDVLSAKRGLLAQAGTIAPAAVPAQSKGMKSEPDVDVVAAGFAKGGEGR